MKRERQIPTLRDPALELALVREIATTSNASRELTTQATGGEPLVEFAGTSNPYIDFHRNDVLHSLQHMRSTAHDEMTFILMTEIKELIFKATHYELFNMQARIKADDVVGALALLPRVRRILELLVKVWDVLSTISTHGFNEFRDVLGTSSGQQSYMYRHVELILGNKSRRLADAHANNPDVYPAMQAALHAPSLYDDVLRLLARRGFELPPEVLERDWSEDYRPHQAVEAAWLRVHEDPAPENELYQLSEALMEIADLFSQFRWRHFISVQRILSLKPGTGGSAGVGWLKHVLDHRFFPELWTIRTMIGA